MLKDQWPPDKWLPVSIAPSDDDLEVCVMDKRGSQALVSSVRKSGTDWVDASTKKAHRHTADTLAQMDRLPLN
jgi:hypothetical protein